MARILGRHWKSAALDWVAYTPTLGAGWGTCTGVSFFYARQGDYLLVRGTFTSGTPSSSLCTITLPTGLAMDATKISTANTSSNPGEKMGELQNVTAGHSSALIAAPGTSTGQVYMGQNTQNNAELTPSTGVTTVGTAEFYTAYFRVPISGWSSADMIKI